MGWGDILKKIGKGVLVGARYASPVVQTVGASIPGPDPFDGIAGILGTVELVGDLVQQQTGTKLDKIQIALPQVEAVIRSTELVRGHEIADEALFSQGSREILEGLLKVTKSLREKNTQTSAPAGPAS